MLLSRTALHAGVQLHHPAGGVPAGNLGLCGISGGHGAQHERRPARGSGARAVAAAMPVGGIWAAAGARRHQKRKARCRGGAAR